MELASCHPSGAENFEVAPRFLENLCTPVLKRILFIVLNDTVSVSDYEYITSNGRITGE